MKRHKNNGETQSQANTQNRPDWEEILDFRSRALLDVYYSLPSDEPTPEEEEEYYETPLSNEEYQTMVEGFKRVTSLVKLVKLDNAFSSACMLMSICDEINELSNITLAYVSKAEFCWIDNSFWSLPKLKSSAQKLLDAVRELKHSDYYHGYGEGEEFDRIENYFGWLNHDDVIQNAPFVKALYHGRERADNLSRHLHTQIKDDSSNTTPDDTMFFGSNALQFVLYQHCALIDIIMMRAEEILSNAEDFDKAVKAPAHVETYVTYYKFMEKDVKEKRSHSIIKKIQMERTDVMLDYSLRPQQERDEKELAFLREKRKEIKDYMDCPAYQLWLEYYNPNDASFDLDGYSEMIYSKKRSSIGKMVDKDVFEPLVQLEYINSEILRIMSNYPGADIASENHRAADVPVVKQNVTVYVNKVVNKKIIKKGDNYGTQIVNREGGQTTLGLPIETQRQIEENERD